MKVRTNKIIITLATAFSAAALLTACDEDFAQITNPSRQTAESLDKLSKCTEKNEGEIAYVKDSDALYLCADSAWKKMVASEKADAQNGKDGKNGTDGKDGKNGSDGKDGKNGANGKNGSYCTVSALKDNSGYDIICDGEKVGKILNGKDGAKGDNGGKGDKGDKGPNGDAGSDCTAKALTDGSGFEMSCAGKVVGTIKNGQNGSKGDAGADCSGKVLENGSGIELTCNGKVVATLQNGVEGAEAKNCESIDDGEGTVTIKCGEGKSFTRYKALCGTEPFEPEKKVCVPWRSEYYLLPLCNGKVYNPYDPADVEHYDMVEVNIASLPLQKCVDGVIVNLCGDKEFDVKTQSCIDKKIYDYCEGFQYDPSTQLCSEEGKILTKCGDKGDGYDPTTQVCSDEGIVLTKCGKEGALFNEKTQVCKGNKILNKCGNDGAVYDPETQLCDVDKVLGKCGDKTYDMETQMCKDGEVLAKLKCGDEGAFYDPATQVCLDDGKVLSKCGDEAYNPTETFCAMRGDVVERIYKKVTIGEQVWMAENLNYETASGSYCYDNQDAMCKTYGRLYTWSVAKSACPDGWHLPTRDEWKTLIAAVGGDYNIVGQKLKATTLWKTEDGITNEDTYGFSALPGGIKSKFGGYFNVGEKSYFWSATYYNGYVAYDLELVYGSAAAGLNGTDKEYAYSVRCLQD